MPPHRVGFLPGVLRPFGLKTGTDFAHFGLEPGVVFKGKEKHENSKWIFRNRFCCFSNLSNDDIIS